MKAVFRLAATISVLSLVVLLPACSQVQVPGAGAVATTAPAGSAPHNFARWEKEIAAYEAQDREQPPGKGGVVFIGSSTIRRWKTLDADFPGQCAINRGFGGSQIVDATHFAERLVFPHAPRMVVLRSGGNDIHNGKSPEQVFEDYKAFVVKVHKRLPKATIVFISISPAPSRWAERDDYKVLNTLVEKYARRKSYLKYVETYEMVLRPDGQARDELFVADRLHFSEEGYRLLADRVRPFLVR